MLQTEQSVMCLCVLTYSLLSQLNVSVVPTLLFLQLCPVLLCFLFSQCVLQMTLCEIQPVPVGVSDFTLSDWTEQSIYDNPSRICHFLHSPLLRSCAQNEELLLLHWLKGSLLTWCFLIHGSITSGLGFREKAK